MRVLGGPISLSNVVGGLLLYGTISQNRVAAPNANTAAGGTLTAGSATKIGAIDFGTLGVNDIVDMHIGVKGTKGATAGQVILGLTEAVGHTAVCTYNGKAAVPSYRQYVVNAQTHTMEFHIKITVQTAGAVILDLVGASLGSDLSYAADDLWFTARTFRATSEFP